MNLSNDLLLTSAALLFSTFTCCDARVDDPTAGTSSSTDGGGGGASSYAAFCKALCGDILSCASAEDCTLDDAGAALAGCTEHCTHAFDAIGVAEAQIASACYSCVVDSLPTGACFDPTKAAGCDAACGLVASAAGDAWSDALAGETPDARLDCTNGKNLIDIITGH